MYMECFIDKVREHIEVMNNKYNETFTYRIVDDVFILLKNAKESDSLVKLAEINLNGWDFSFKDCDELSLEGVEFSSTKNVEFVSKFYFRFVELFFSYAITPKKDRESKFLLISKCGNFFVAKNNIDGGLSTFKMPNDPRSICAFEEILGGKVEDCSLTLEEVDALRFSDCVNPLLDLFDIKYFYKYRGLMYIV